MNEIITIGNSETNELFDDIKNLIEQSRSKVYKTINNEIVNLHWNIGKMIAERQNGMLKLCKEQLYYIKE